MGDIFKEYKEVISEQSNMNTRDIDIKSTEEILKLINSEDQKVADAVSKALPSIAKAVDIITEAFNNGGRLFYAGAGTSGRLGIVDASECPPTFGTDPDMVQGIIAGGEKAIVGYVEGAEDDEFLGAQDVEKYGINYRDVLVGISASGRAPYIRGAMRNAKQIGAKVIGISNNIASPMSQHTDVMIEVPVGPEAIYGSTRMKSGTAQKMVLNMLSTASMVKIGKVYDNFMVDMMPLNNKLISRAKRMIAMTTEASPEQVEKVFHESGGHVKTAIVMIKAGVRREEAEKLLKEAKGFVRGAIKIGECL